MPVRAMLKRRELGHRYDVVIIGGGGHGLALAYYLAKNHGIRRVAVLERSYIGSGGSGRNTTVLRANYRTPEAVAFFRASLELYRRLSGELEFNLLRSPRGLLWLAHSDASLRLQRERAHINRALGVDTVFITPDEVASICPLVDLTAGGRAPVLGAAYHSAGAIIRHDAVVWGYAAAGQRLGVEIHQGVEVVDVRVEHGRCVGVLTTEGRVSAASVVSAAGGYVSLVARMAGVRLPITTHLLQAFVTEPYKRILDPIVASSDLLIYISQSARGELVVGSEIEDYTGYSTGSTFHFLAEASARAIDLLPFMARLLILRQWGGLCDMTPDYSPLMGRTEVEDFYIDGGWGTWGFKAIPIAGHSMAELIATGRTPAVIAPFSLERFRENRLIPERSSAGTH
jgi:sarcosine oxidase subunit beta